MYFNAIFPSTSTIWIAVLLLIIGIVFIIKGGDFFVDAAVWVAEVLKMPKFLIGATIVSIATTLPEMIVSIIAVCGGNYAISIGNAVGSVTANTGLILAISAIFVSGVIERRDFGVKSILIILSTLIIFLFGLSGKFGILPSVVLLVILIYYMYETAVSAKRAVAMKETIEATDNEEVDGKKVIANIVKFLIGAAGIVLGADLLVENAKVVASALGVSDGIIAITIVAIGTSLPELVTCVVAALKQQSDLAIGNIIGSSIFNVLFVLGITGVIQPMNFDTAFLFDGIIAILAVVFLFLFTIRDKYLCRKQGFILVAFYIGYLAYLIIK